MAQFYFAHDKVVFDILHILGLDEKKSAISRVALIIDASEMVKVNVTLIPQYPQLEKIYELLEANKPAMEVNFHQEQRPYHVDTNSADDLPLHGYQL